MDYGKDEDNIATDLVDDTVATNEGLADVALPPLEECTPSLWEAIEARSSLDELGRQAIRCE